jgi:hypothetical protein
MNRHDRRAAAAAKGVQRFSPKPLKTMFPVDVVTGKYAFYDLTTNWSNVVPHLDDPEANEILARDFSHYTYGRFGIEFDEGKLPCDYEIYDNREHAVSTPPYWRYVKEGACHWLVNFNLRIANLVLPDRQWRIINSDMHSTVWDGSTTLFDFLGQALFGNADETFDMARGVRDDLPRVSSKTLDIGVELDRLYAHPSVFDMAYRVGDFDDFLSRLPVPLRPGFVKLREHYEAWQTMRNTYAVDDRTPYDLFWGNKKNIAMLKSLTPLGP